MTLYEKLTDRKLPEHTLVLPLQYSLFGNFYYCVLFAQIQQEIGKGVSKRVEQALVIDLLGEVPIPEVASLKGQHIVLYRPRDNVQSFINDIIAIVKLNQMKIKEYNARANIVKIRGHSLYISEEYQGTESDYTKLLYEGYLKLETDMPTLLAVLRSALGTRSSPEVVQQFTDEILQANDLVDSCFMIGEILPYSLDELFPQMDKETLLQNVYQMVYTIAAYAAEGIFFRDLQPSNFRLNQKQQVKLIDPSYIDALVPKKNRYMSFIKQTTHEYLPNLCAYYQHKNEQEKLERYFGEFPAGVCIGMLERVLKRLFLPKYMGEKLDQLYRNPQTRLQKSHECKYQEDVDFFRDVVEELPSANHFSHYQGNIAYYMKREGIYSPEVTTVIACLLTMLREFSYPVFTSKGCRTLLADEKGDFISIERLPSLVQSLLGIAAVSPVGQTEMTGKHKETGRYTKPVPTLPTWPPPSPQPSSLMTPPANPLTNRPLQPIAKASLVANKMSATSRLALMPRSARKDIMSQKPAVIPDNQEAADQETEQNSVDVAASVEGVAQEKKPEETTTLISKPSLLTNKMSTTSRLTLMPWSTRKDSMSQKPAATSDNQATAEQEKLRREQQSVDFDAWVEEIAQEKKPEETTTPVPAMPTQPPLEPTQRRQFRPKEAIIGHENKATAEIPEAGGSTQRRVFRPKEITLGDGSMLSGEPLAKTEPQQHKTFRPKEITLGDSRQATGDSKAEESAGKQGEAASEPAGGLRTRESKSRKFTYQRVVNEERAATGSFAQEDLKFVKEVDAILDVIEQTDLAGIKVFIRESQIFTHVLKENLNKLMQQNKSPEDLKLFFKKANALLQGQETDMVLLRQTQGLVRDDIHRELEKHASVEYKQLYHLATLIQKCKKVICSYLVYIAKTRFLVTADMGQDMTTLLPKPGENVLQFICDYYWRHHSFVSLEELANNLASELSKTGKRMP